MRPRVRGGMFVPKVGRVRHDAKQNAPADGRGVCFAWVPDNDLLSRGIPRTIIGVLPFHGPVRDGKEWFQQAKVVRQ